MLPTYLIERFVEEYRCALHSSASLQHLSEFHDETKIREISQIERRKVFDAVIQRISELRGEQISELLVKLDLEINNCTKKFIATNRHHIQESELLLGQLISFLSQDFRLSVQTHLSFHPYMTIRRLQDFIESKREEAIFKFARHWKPGTTQFHKEFQTKLEVELRRIQMEVEERHKNLLEGPVASEKIRFQFLEDTLLQKLNRLKADLNDHEITGHPIGLDCKLEELLIFVTDQERFSSARFCHVQYQIANEIKATLKELILAGATSVSLIDQLALKIQREFTILTETHQMREDRIKLEIRELISKKADEYSSRMGQLLHHNNRRSNDRTNWLERCHSAISRRLENSFKMDIRRIDNCQFIEVHCDSLKEKINQHWLALKNRDDNIQINAAEVNEEDSQTQAKSANTTSNGRTTSGDSTESYLVFRLCHSHISMGACINGNLEAVQIAGDTKIPLIVGRAGSRELVFGKEAIEKCTGHIPPLKHWWITDYLELTNLLSCKQDVDFNVGYSKFTAEVSLEYLLGYFLRSVREHIEVELGVHFTSAIIAVPSWFCSTHRIQVKDAAYVSGLRKSRIINEESVAAYSHFHLRERRTSKRSSFILLFSENFGVITVILFDCYLKTYRDLKIEDLSFSNSKMSSKSPKFETAIEFVRKICASVLQKHDISPTHAVLLSEDPVWLRAFHSIALENGCKERVEISEWDLLSVLVGKFDDIRNCLPFDEFPLEVFKKHLRKVKMGSPSTERRTPSYNQQAPKNERIIQYFQKSIMDRGEDVRIGDLWIWRSFPSSGKIHPDFEYGRDGTVKLKGVKFVPLIMNGGESERELTDFTWTTPNMSLKEKRNMAQFIDAIIESRKETFSNALVKRFLKAVGLF